MKLLGILTILTAALQTVQGQCVLETSIPCTITQWGMDYGKSCVDEETGKSNIVRAVGLDCRDVAVKLKYKICKGNHFDRAFTFNTDTTWGRLRGDDVGLALSSIPESAVCVSEPIYTRINTCDTRTAFGLQVEATTPEGSFCRSYTHENIIPDENENPVTVQTCELETSINCTIKEGDVDKPCEGNIFYNEINPTTCVSIPVEFKYEICKANATQETTTYYFNDNRNRTSASLRISDNNATFMALNTSSLSEMCRSKIVNTTISACEGPVTALLDARARIGNDDPYCNSYSRLYIIPSVRTKEPSSTPTSTPSSKPSPTPSSKPSSTPSSTPSSAPSSAPSLVCETDLDDWTFRLNGLAGRGCGWVGNYPYDRCTGSAKDACKKTCCGIN